MKVNSGGGIRWTRLLGVDLGDRILGSPRIDVAPNGDVLVASETVNGFIPSDSDDFVLLRMDSSGRLLWERTHDVTADSISSSTTSRTSRWTGSVR